MTSIGRMALVALTITGLWACKSQESSIPSMKGDSKVLPPAVSEGYYMEEQHQERLYVFGTQAAHDTFEKSKLTPQITKTYIGQGPSGQSVVLEADAKSTDLQERLRGEFNRRHNLDLK